MLEADSEAAARSASAAYPALTGLDHVHDPQRSIGSQVAQGLGAPGKTAWDTYLLYATSARWTSTPPVPAAWFHQLQDEPWADPSHFRWGMDLHAAIRAAVEEELASRPT
jgi:hypothetical protein